MALDVHNRSIGLSLSGGGVRAAAFHAGVLKWLAENGLLERVVQISTVSGGSLFAGLVFHFSGYSWPSSTQYIQNVLPRIRTILTTKSLQMNSFLRFANPLNWRHVLFRANILAKSITNLWGISATLGDLPKVPLWSMNGTTAETGRRFRFKDSKIGDYELGYTEAANFKLAEALAVSAAFPGGIGPLRLETKKYTWYKRKKWNSAEPADKTVPSFAVVHLYDGGVYDNLGLEPLFEVGKQAIKNENDNMDFLIASDAAAPFSRIRIPGPLNPFRLKRVADIAFDQARSLRVRAFVNYLQKNMGAGMYIQIGSVPSDRIEMYGKDAASIAGLLSARSWISSDQVLGIARYPTSLRRMKEEHFDSVANHGYETALWNHLLFIKS